MLRAALRAAPPSLRLRRSPSLPRTLLHAANACAMSTVIRRRVLEIGSGSIKCAVADVDVASAAIVNQLYAGTRTVLFMADLKAQQLQPKQHQNHTARPAAEEGGGAPGASDMPVAFSDAIVARGRGAVRELLAESEALMMIQDAPAAQGDATPPPATSSPPARSPAASRTAAVATQAFRSAANGAAAAVAVVGAGCGDSPVRILSAADEARLGFETARALSACPADELVAWDCGAGSFQFSLAGSVGHHDGHGSSTVEAAAARLRGGGGAGWGGVRGAGGAAAAPMSEAQVASRLLAELQTQLRPIDPTVAEALRNCCDHIGGGGGGGVERSAGSGGEHRCHRVVAIGSQHSIFNQQRLLARGQCDFTPADVERSIAAVAALGTADNAGAGTGAGGPGSGAAAVDLDARRLLLEELELANARAYGDADDGDPARCRDNAPYMLPKLVLLLALLRHAGIARATYVKSHGNTPALLTDPALWAAAAEGTAAGQRR